MELGVTGSSLSSPRANITFRHASISHPLSPPASFWQGWIWSPAPLWPCAGGPMGPRAPWGWCKKQEMALGDWRELSQGSGWVIKTLMRGDGQGSESSKAPGTRLQGHPQLSPLARGDSHQ